MDAYHEEKLDGKDEVRTVLHLHPQIAPVKVAVFPLVKKDGLSEMARRIEEELRDDFATFYDQGGAIGRRYRRMDEIGTPFCVTVDYETMDRRSVTLRLRDSMEQIRVPIEGIADLVRRETLSYRRFQSIAG